MHAALLTTGEIADRRHQLGGFEAETLHQLSRRHLLAIHNVARLIAGKHFLDLVLAELLQLIEALREHRELHRLANVHMACGRGERAINQLKQRGLAGTIRTDDAEAVARANQPSHIIQNLAAGNRHLACSRGDTGCSSVIIRIRCSSVTADGFATRVHATNLAIVSKLRIAALSLGLLTRFLSGLDGFRHAGVHQARVSHVGDRHLNGTMQLRLGVHGVDHIHAGSGRGERRHIRVDIGHALRFFENLRHVDQIDHLFAETGGGHLLQFKCVTHRRHIGNQFACGLDVELLLGGAGTSTAGKPCELLASQIAALGFAHIGLAIAFHALQHICGIAALERLDHAIVDFPHRFADLVQEPAIVGHEQQSALAFGPAVLQMFGKPVDSDHVEMVGGLVKCENIPILEQQSGQIGAATLAAGQGADLGIQAHAAEQCLDDFTGSVIGRPFVVGAPLKCGFANGGVVIKGITLVKHAERESATLCHAAGIRLLSTAEQVQQRGFAVAVLADDADAVAFKNTLRYISEDGFGSESERNVFQSNVISRHDSPM